MPSGRQNTEVPVRRPRPLPPASPKWGVRGGFLGGACRRRPWRGCTPCTGSAITPCLDAGEAADCFRGSYDLAMEPIHSRHGAADLAAKAPLADGLRRGLSQLGLELESGPHRGSGSASC